MTTRTNPTEPTLYATQGGGLATYDAENRIHRWYSHIPEWLVDAEGATRGDPIPEEWGTTGPINQEAHDQLNGGLAELDPELDGYGLSSL